MSRLTLMFHLVFPMAVLLPLLALLPARAAQKPPGQPAATEREDSVYLYGFFEKVSDCKEFDSRVKRLSLHPTVLLSIEQGADFLLDLPGKEALMECALASLRSSGHTVKGLFLQDTVYLDNTEEAVRRATKLNDFIIRHPGSFTGVQVDIEPYVTEDWSCGDNEDHRRIFRSLIDVLRVVRERMPGVPLGVAVGWWTPIVADKLPEASPESLFKVADEIYLMVYGDEGGPVVGGSAGRILSRVNTPDFFPGPGRVYVGLGTYEYQSPQQLQTEMETIRRGLSTRPHFAGTAIFHAESVFNAPLLRIVFGTVTDPAGQKLKGVEVSAGGVRDTTNRCGQFKLRGLPAARDQLVLTKDGFQTRQVPVEVTRLGVEQEIGKIILEKAPALSSKDSK